MKKGHWEVLDDEGVWHKIDGFQVASYRLDGVPADRIRFVEE